MHIKEPTKIEDKSMDTIDSVAGDINLSDEEMLVAKRMIHITGDFEYWKIIVLKDSSLEEAKASIEEGIEILTDTKMAYQGINKPASEKSSCELVYYIDDDDVREAAKAKGTARLAYVLEKAIENGVKGSVIGNAPTALFCLIESIKKGEVDPDSVAGAPVGFVGVAESKEALREVETVSISTAGTKGGSNVVASIINALLHMAYPRWD